jgi:multidrug efflux pump subunit AcrA (membrane-fusion protein)
LSSSKRAEQNRKAQRAFRERRDQFVSSLYQSFPTNLPIRHVKALESRSQLLDAALASADEANRRWEECRALVDQLRIENTALRAALGQSQMLPPGSGQSTANGSGGARAPHSGSNNHGAHQEKTRNPEGSNEFKNDSGGSQSDAHDQA